LSLAIFKECKPLIGVVHLPPLPGSPGYRRMRFPDIRGEVWGIDSILEYALNQAKLYESIGFDGVIIENYGDKPYSVHASKGQIASLAKIVSAITRELSIPVGISILRNAGYESIIVTHVSGARFTRINSLCELRVSQEGILYPEARRVARALQELNIYEDLYLNRLLIMADINVKHSYPLHEESDITNIVRDCVERCGYPIYSIILTGSRTGEEPGYDTVEKVIGVVRELGVQLYVGSGVTHTNISKYWSIADGFIVGTSIKVGGRTENPISEDRAIALAKLVKHYRSTIGC